MTEVVKARKETDSMNLHDIARIIRGLEAEGWDSKRILDFIMQLGSSNEQREPETDDPEMEES